MQMHVYFYFYYFFNNSGETCLHHGFLGREKVDTFALLCLAKKCGLYVRGIDVCGYGYIHGYPRKICEYGYGYGWEISYPRQACGRTTTVRKARP